MAVDKCLIEINGNFGEGIGAHVADTGFKLDVGIKFHEQIQIAQSGRHGQLRIEHLLIAHTGIGTKPDTDGGFAGGNAVEVGRFQKQTCCGILYFGIQAAHNAGNGHRLIVRADHQRFAVDLTLDFIKGSEGKLIFKAADIYFLHHRIVEGVHGLTQFQHDVVGQVGQEVDGTQAAIEQTDSHIHRRDLAGNSGYDSGSVAIATLVLNFYIHFGQVFNALGIENRHGAQRTIRNSGEFTGDAVVTPQVGTVGKRFVIDFKYNIINGKQILNVYAQRGIGVQFHDAVMVGRDAQFFFRAAHTAGLKPCNLSLYNIHTAGLTAFGGKGDDHALTDIGRTAHAVHHRFAGIDFEQVQFFGVGMILDAFNASRHDTLHVSAHHKDILHLGGGEGKALDQCGFVESRKINKVFNPIH